MLTALLACSVGCTERRGTREVMQIPFDYYVFADPEGTQAADAMDSLWPDLFTRIAQDPDSQALLSALYGGHPTRFLVGNPGDTSRVAGLPEDGPAVQVVVRDEQPVTLQPEGETRSQRICQRMIQYQVTVWDAVTTRDHDSFQALRLLVEDYLRRNLSGCGVSRVDLMAADRQVALKDAKERERLRGQNRLFTLTGDLKQFKARVQIEPLE